MNHKHKNKTHQLLQINRALKFLHNKMRDKEDIKNTTIIIKEIKIKTINGTKIDHIKEIINIMITSKEKKEVTRAVIIITERITKMMAQEEIKMEDSNNIEIITIKMETIEAVKEEDIKAEIKVIDSKLIIKVRLFVHRKTTILK